MLSLVFFARPAHSTANFATTALIKCKSVCVNHLKRCKTFNLLNFRYWVFSHRVSVLLCFVALSPVVLCAAVCSTACQGWVPVCFFPTSPPFSSLVLPACCVLPSGCFCRCVFLLFPVVICRLLSSFPSSSPLSFFVRGVKPHKGLPSPLRISFQAW